ncbi:hypothetical protein ABT382_26425 [Streptomyces pharetrae]|uniref:hypothetical protein n=1 Tax=Streptomyces pharetrae TaxID=291370 RepID=UPI00334B2D7E
MVNAVRGIVGSGRTNPGEGWQPYNNNMYITVDTSSADFRSDLDTPVYVISLSGSGAKVGEVVGAAAVYEPTERGFRVYLQHFRDANLPPSQAQEGGWYINWTGVQNLD